MLGSCASLRLGNCGTFPTPDLGLDVGLELLVLDSFINCPICVELLLESLLLLAVDCRLESLCRLNSEVGGSSDSSVE